MDSASGFALTDPVALLSALGAAGLFLVMFAETGLAGFFLPGDALLFTAGILATTDAHPAVHLALPVAIAASAAGAVLGAQTGFALGRRGGAFLLRRDTNPRLLAGIRRSSELLSGYGYGKAIVLARFIPVARTVLNPLLGLSDLPARTFLFWQSLGGLVWTSTITLAGYFLGDTIPDIDQYVLPVVLIIVVLSAVAPAVRSLTPRSSPDAPRR